MAEASLAAVARAVIAVVARGRAELGAPPFAGRNDAATLDAPCSRCGFGADTAMSMANRTGVECARLGLS